METKPVVFLICTGVGHVNRGYESFTVECFNELIESTDLDFFLLKGGGKSLNNEIRIACIQRRSKLASFVNKVTGKEAYWIEQLTFLIGMIPYLIKYKPAVIYYSDFVLGTFLWHLRRFLRFKYRLLFSNGAPNGPPFKTEDHIQQLLPVYMDQATNGGTPAEMQTLLPYGFNINIEQRNGLISQKEAMMHALGLPVGKKIILSVGAVNKHHKRMHYLINEVAKLPDSYFLVILGQFETETPELLQQASNMLQGRFYITNLPYEKVKDYYIAADYFVLASLTEGFGRVLIEALSYGLSCIVNDYVNARQVLKENGVYVDMQKDGALSACFANGITEVHKNKLISAAYEIYSWDILKKKYLSMISKQL